ncbi:stage 0 sporulation family protein [candidate division WOR-3 bacterium]|uniref:Stage 0 sporulation family protein n=1 Tax=candidate division WOR-3 bacterium TaxID=2052148 RepID=A0A9D5QEN6_UNCW3|nr:stage 0 sporulation family protein [candidate division WOR-3 bacterium]MBD3365205.1 stage 0 sporulation family protein [candidate division WOR-3 bacterium]
MSNIHYLVECHPLMRVVVTAAVGLKLNPGDWVVLRFKGCEDVGIVRGYSEDPQAKAIAIREAEPEDIQAIEDKKIWEEESLAAFREIVKKYELPMKVVDVHAWADQQKIAFYFLSECRLDFRKLHKEISSMLGCRVVIKQIGTRDHARLIGGLGPCGRPLCCNAFLKEIRPISLRTARKQNLYVNPDKISGMCGRLLCCLRFEDDVLQAQYVTHEEPEELDEIGDD